MGQLLQYEQQLLKETNLINAPFSELNLDGVRSPTERQKHLVLSDGCSPQDDISGFPSPLSEDSVPSPALDLLEDKTTNTCLSDSAFQDTNCQYAETLGVLPSPGSDDVPSPTGSELSNCSEYYDNGASSAPLISSKPSSLNLIKKRPSRTFTLELSTNR